MSCTTESKSACYLKNTNTPCTDKLYELILCLLEDQDISNELIQDCKSSIATIKEAQDGYTLKLSNLEVLIDLLSTNVDSKISELKSLIELLATQILAENIKYENSYLKDVHSVKTALDAILDIVDYQAPIINMRVTPYDEYLSYPGTYTIIIDVAVSNYTNLKSITLNDELISLNSGVYLTTKTITQTTAFKIVGIGKYGETYEVEDTRFVVPFTRYASSGINTEECPVLERFKSKYIGTDPVELNFGAGCCYLLDSDSNAKLKYIFSGTVGDWTKIDGKTFTIDGLTYYTYWIPNRYETPTIIKVYKE